MIQITKPLIVIVGPTAVGKTELSVRLAKKLDGEIVSADSRLFYRGMDIGTAKPTQIEMDDVSHHLINIAEPDDEWSLARYLPRAQDIINDILASGKHPLSGRWNRPICPGCCGRMGSSRDQARSTSETDPL